MVAVIIICSLLSGYGIALFILSLVLRKSNDYGNSTGTFKDYAKFPIYITESKKISVYEAFYKDQPKGAAGTNVLAKNQAAQGQMQGAQQGKRPQ